LGKDVVSPIIEEVVDLFDDLVIGLVFDQSVSVWKLGTKFSGNRFGIHHPDTREKGTVHIRAEIYAKRCAKLP